MLSLASLTAFGQALTGQLTGIVTDATGAIVPESKITLKNELSGDIRRSISNNEGFFSFAAVPAGTYTILIERDGFASWERKGISMSPGDRRTVSDIVLGAAGTTATVNITATGDEIAPSDSGEKSAVITEKQIQNLALVGRNSAELIKILPGFTPTSTGITNAPGFTGNVTGINGNGDGGKQSFVGNYSANGTRTDTLDIVIDGARATDPGCNCATPFNPNVDMISEFKAQTSNFSAENARGPVVISGITKGGGSDFHGTAYIYARHHALNSNSSQNNAVGQPKPESSYYYPGFNIGGPVLIPGTGFNKDRSKLNFFFGFEYIKQNIDTGLLQSWVPTTAMLNGDFSAGVTTGTDKFGRTISTGYVGGLANNSVGGIACDPYKYASEESTTPLALPAYCNGAYKLKMSGVGSAIDPNGKVLASLLPQANVGSSATSSGFNYARQIVFGQPNTQMTTRVDYSISDNTKLYVKYNRQTDFQQFPVQFWWRNGGAVPYPTAIVADNRSHSTTTNLTHVFSPTLTNEVVFGLSYVTFPNRLQDPSKTSRAALGYTSKGVYKNGVDQIPAFAINNGPSVTNPGGFEFNNGGVIFANKWLPSISDNVTKVFSKHTAKFGAYWDFVINSQPNTAFTNGQLTFDGAAASSSGNAFADLLMGRYSSYGETQLNTLNNIGWQSFQFYGQDSWKVKSSLTLEFGLRVAHLGGIYDREGKGLAVWDPTKYRNNTVPGASWSALDSSLPTSGRSVNSLFYMPRVGFAWDMFQTGNTVLRGGFGTYYFSDNQQGGYTGAISVSNLVGATNLSGGDGKTISTIDANSGSAAAVPSSLTLMDPNDNKQPAVHSYSLTLSQRLPGKLLLDLAYVGNKGRDLINQNHQNINPVMLGTTYTESERLAAEGGNDSIDLGKRILNAKYGLTYQDISLVQHNTYNDYNALQMLLSRQTGFANFTFAYTFSKNLGIRGTDLNSTGQSADNTSLFGLRERNYGVLSTDRTHVVSFAYNLNLPNFSNGFARGNKFAAAVLDGWQFSGITQATSGAPIQAFSVNFGMSGTVLDKDGKSVNLNSRRMIGTTASQLQPRMTCNPLEGLSENQFINVNCFAAPVQNANGTWNTGPYVMPYLKGPAFFNTDLSVYKTWGISESKRIQIRASAFNFLNHPLKTLDGSNLSLNFKDGVLEAASKANFGRITSSRIGSRQIQLALKFYF